VFQTQPKQGARSTCGEPVENHVDTLVKKKSDLIAIFLLIDFAVFGITPLEVRGTSVPRADES
jgi:hypothetical protein